MPTLRTRDCVGIEPQGIEFASGPGRRLDSKRRSRTTSAPVFDFVFTVCDDAASEACPVWPGQPMTAHWGIPDPAAVEGSSTEIALAFNDTYRMLWQRIGVFAALPIRSLDSLTLQSKLRDIGRMAGATAKAEAGR